MPAPAQPPPKPVLPPNKIQVAGRQEHFKEAAVKLAAELGWFGPPDNVTVGIRVEDAQNWLAKVFHEHFQAGAKGEPQPDYKETCVHLSVDDAREQAMVDGAFRLAYEAGKGADLFEVEKSIASFAANIEMSENFLAKVEGSTGKNG